MTAPTTEFVRIAEQGQQAAAQAVRTWAESLQSYVDALGQARPAPRIAELSAAVDAYFDKAGEVLATQREAATKALTASNEAVETAVERMRSFAAAFVPATSGS